MKHKNKFLRVLLVVALILSTLATSTINTEVYAAKKVYGDKLKLNNNIKLNKTSKFTKTGYYQEGTFFPKKAKTKIKYNIKCSRKSSGKNYVVTYKVTYKFLSDPKISTDTIEYDDWYWGMTKPFAMYTVFDYSTGLSLDGENDCGVTVKSLSDWKCTYYPKQNYTFTFGDYSEESWLRNYKTISKSFSVTYPKKYKNVVVGIGFVNRTPDYESEETIPTDNILYDNQKAPYGKTDYYKKGKNTMSYMRLNK